MASIRASSTRPNDYHIVPVIGRVEITLSITAGASSTTPTSSDAIADEVASEGDVLYATSTSIGYAVVAHRADGLYCLQPDTWGMQVVEVTVAEATSLYQFARREHAQRALSEFQRQQMRAFLGEYSD